MGSFVEQFHAMVPEIVQQELVRSLFPSYLTAAIDASGYSRPTERKSRPYLRLWNLEEAFRQIAVRHPEIVTVEEAANRTKSYWWPQLRVHDKIVITASAVRLPGEFPRDADFRETMAEINYDFFPSEVERPLYVVLVHGDDGEQHHAPAFGGIGIPARDYRAFAEYESLFDRHKETVAEALGIKPEQVQEETTVRRRILARRTKFSDGA